MARLSATGQPGWRIFAPAGEKNGLVESLGLPEASPEAQELVRIENGVPRYGADFTETNLPQETQLMHALHFNKGCYIGQEIVERVRSRGHVNKLLVHLSIESAKAFEVGAKVLSEGKEVGTLASSAYSPAAGAVFAFAYLRGDVVQAKAALSVEGLPATIAASGPAVPSGSRGCS